MDGRASSGVARLLAKSWLTASVYVVAVASVSLNVALAHRIRSISDVQRQRMIDRVLQAGAVVSPINAKALDGKQEKIEYKEDSRPTVLYVFTPTCSWCARNMDNVRRLVDRGDHQYRFIGISLSDAGLKDYVVKNRLMLPIYSSLSAETIRAYKLGSTPQTIVVSPEGTILQDWVGAYVGDQKSQIEAFFHVSLPGLRELPKAEKSKPAEVN